LTVGASDSNKPLIIPAANLEPNTLYTITCTSTKAQSDGTADILVAVK
jgi:hypothetical protein